LLDFVSNVKAASSSAACLQMVSPISEVELPRTLLMCSTTFTFTLFKRGCTTSCRNFLASASCNQIQGNRLSARTNTLQRKQYQTTSARNTEECNKCFAPRFAVTTLIAGRLIDQAYAGQRYKSSFNTVKAQWNSTGKLIPAPHSARRRSRRQRQQHRRPQAKQLPRVPEHAECAARNGALHTQARQ